MQLARTARFKKAWRRLTEEERESGRKALRNLGTDLRYPWLRARKIKGAERLWEARVSRSIRMTFHIEGDVVVLRNIGRHDEALENP